jgi:hypothetical protein
MSDEPEDLEPGARWRVSGKSGETGAKCDVSSIRGKPDIWNLTLDTRHLTPGARHSIPGTGHLTPGT